MNNFSHARLRALSLLALTPLSLAMSMALHAGDADTNVGSNPDTHSETLETVNVNAAAMNTPASAASLTQSSLLARSPQTQISQNYIENFVTPVADYGTILRVAPSYTSSSPNGPGFSEAKSQNLRGFPDGQFNVTYDGIPFGDTNDFTHHTTSYFPAATIGSALIDRSPGDATTIGYASFGGSINLYSLNTSATPGARIYGLIGENNTQQIGAALNSGTVAALGDTHVLLNAEHATTDGALTNGDSRNNNLFLKTQTAFGESTTLTVLAVWDKIHFNNPDGTTLKRALAEGYDAALGSDPTKSNYYGYNYQDKQTDMEYVGLAHDFGGGWRIDNKVYSYYYNNLSHELFNDTSSSYLSQVKAAKPYAPGQAATDVAGALKLNAYRTTGDILRVIDEQSMGTLSFGLWLEHTHNHRNRFAVDDTTGTPYNENKTYQNTFYEMHDYVDTVQPYVQYAWNVTSDFTLSGGARYLDFKRSLNAAINQNNLPGTGGELDKKWNKVLPSLDANYRIDQRTSIYGQISKGLLGPNLNTFYSGNPLGNNQVAPQQSTAYQAGVVTRGDAFTLSADVYQVDFDNYIAKSGSGANAVFFNAGSVRYRGLEVEGNLLIGGGFSIYANGSINRGTYQEDGLASAGQAWKSGQIVSNVPRYTGVLGLLYQDHDWKASLLTKFNGSQYQGKNGEADGALYQVGAYSVTNFTLARGFDAPFGFGKHADVRVGVNNLLNTHHITDNMGPATSDTSGGTDPSQFLYYFVPGRAVYLGLRIDL